MPQRKAVRALALQAGFRLDPLPLQEAVARCCGFGGQPAIANPEYARFVARRRIEESDLPYITYCINCRDIFAAEGKETRHILDILFPPEEQASGAEDGAADQRAPDVTTRRRNRIWLKNALLARFGSPSREGESCHKNTTPDAAEEKPFFHLIMDDTLRRKMDRQRILEEEAAEVIAFAERTGRKIRDEDAGTFHAHLQAGLLTCWVEYRPGTGAGEWVLMNIYCHRMTIQPEPVWKGVKREE